MIRATTDLERQDVAAFFDAIASGLADAVLGGHALVVVPRDDVVAVCLASTRAAGLDPALVADADHAGLRIGTWEDGRFALDLQGAVLMARHTRRRMVRVNEKATRLWLYGRVVLGDSVLDFDPSLEVGDTCVVADERWEAIGLGQVMGRFKGGGEAVRPLHDLGTYLRDQGA